MGEEIQSTRFSREDFETFDRRVAEETEILEGWVEDGTLSQSGGVGGFELEAWLVNDAGRPAPVNEVFLDRLDSALVVPELARFNVELNGKPHHLGPGMLASMHAEMQATWTRCQELGNEFGVRLASIGILPTVQCSDLTLANMSPLKRYRALNEQIFRLRKGKPIELRIDGPEPIDLLHDDVMLEAAATSFQIHLKVSVAESTAVYNASKMLSAPMVAVAANSPLLFGHRLWQETRIPVFEQAVSVGGSEFGRRVGFGRDYVSDSLLRCFQVNRQFFPVLLPRLFDAPAGELQHLRLHNGTIWRWNRPLIGFDDSGRPHIRIEHRVIPAGPTLVDMVANSALYFGAAKALSAEIGDAPENRLPFARAQADFYKAARYGLEAQISWLDGDSGSVRRLVLERILPLAGAGLAGYGFDETEIGYWLGIIRRRVESGRNGAWWQNAWIDKYGRDMEALTHAYLDHQQTDEPVHTWTLD